MQKTLLEQLAKSEQDLQRVKLRIGQLRFEAERGPRRLGYREIMEHLESEWATVLLASRRLRAELRAGESAIFCRRLRV